MNFGRHVILASVVALFALAGCASPKKSFLDTSFPKVEYSDIKKRDEPLRLKLIVEFQRNGEHFAKGDIPLKDYTARILKRSGIVSPIDALSPAGEHEQGEIRVVLNNIADSSTVAAEASGTGFPLWMVGKTITDAYELAMFITTAETTISRTGIKHAVHTAIGNMSIPDSAQAFPQDDAFGRVLEQMILRALQDFQKSGELQRLDGPGRKSG